MKKPRIPRATVNRLPLYLQCLESLPAGQSTVSSMELAQRARENSAKVRKDLSFLGSYGVRGVGYDVDHLRFQIKRELGLTRVWPVLIVGAGNLGQALAKYRGFAESGFSIVGVYDADPSKVDSCVGDLRVRSMDDLPGDVTELQVAIGIIATPASAAQEVAEYLAAAGIKSILNFAPAVLTVPPGIEVRHVDVSTELQILSFYVRQSLAEL